MTRRPARRRAGFTLLELLLVVFLLAAVAASAATLVDQVDLQGRHDLTRSRREQVRRAILGDPSRSVNGQPVVSGFVADMGRLPGSLRELLEPLDAAGSPLAAWSLDAARGVGAGWRGPYAQGAELERFVGLGLGGLPSARESPALRDGWGTRRAGPDPLITGSLADLDFAQCGWDYRPDFVAAGDVWLASLGRDGARDAVSPPAEEVDRDTPSLGGLGDPPAPGTFEQLLLVRAADWRVPLAGWGARVTLRGALPAGAADVVLRLDRPLVGAAVTWAPLDSAAVPAAVDAPLDLAFGAGEAPWGVRPLRVVVRDAGGEPLFEGPWRAVVLVPRASAAPLDDGWEVELP